MPPSGTEGGSEVHDALPPAMTRLALGPPVWAACGIVPNSSNGEIHAGVGRVKPTVAAVHDRGGAQVGIQASEHRGQKEPEDHDHQEHDDQRSAVVASTGLMQPFDKIEMTL